MNNITHKHISLRFALAQAVVAVSLPETIEAIKNKTVPKGDVFEIARAAGLFAVKRTSDMIPDCHPMPVESTSIAYELEGLEVKIMVAVETVYKTGVEVEAMHGASVVALTIYDMLKPIDKGIEIKNIKLVEKTGGKSAYKRSGWDNLTAAVIVCSDTISAGEGQDTSGKYIKEELEDFGLTISEYAIIPDDMEQIQNKVIKHSDLGTDVIIFSGGTGLSPRDITPESVKPLLDREIPGLMEQARRYGQDRVPYSMLSRGVAGMRGKSLVLTFPGSERGAMAYMHVIFPFAFHIFKVMEGERH